MNEGEVRFVTRAYDHTGKFLDSNDFIAGVEVDIYEHEEGLRDFMENVFVENERGAYASD